jgi:pimeloyl-ACP methyl ester carboxylesterase
MDMTAPSFLFVHGSWHGPWTWNLVRPLLEARGHATAAVALPSMGSDPATLGGLAEDSAAIARSAGELPGEVVVVGHSYGGAPVSGAEFGSQVRRLIYLAAFMPDAGRPYVSYLPPGPLPPYVGMRDDGTFAVPEGQALPAFYSDCGEPLASWAEALLVPQSQKVLGVAAPVAAWRSIPSAYVLTTGDRALPPDFQRQFLPQADRVAEFDSSHSPMLSRPIDLTDLLVRLAAP